MNRPFRAASRFAPRHARYGLQTLGADIIESTSAQLFRAVERLLPHFRVSLRGRVRNH